jgi:hypothetical protein
MHLTLLLACLISLGTSCSTYNGGKIFCFGDELTAGISKKEDSIHTPFATTLQTSFPQVEVFESSVYGEFTYHMRQRFEKELPKLQFSTPSVIVLWGGVNDVSKHVKVNTTVKHLIAMHDFVRNLKERQPLQYGGIMHTILITLPQLKSQDLNREKRLKVNKRLRHYAAGTHGFVLVLDIENVFRYSRHCGNREKKLTKGITDVNVNVNVNAPPPPPATHSLLVGSGHDTDTQCHSIPVHPSYQKYWDRPTFWTLSPLGYAAIGRMVHATACNQTNLRYLV